MTKSNYNKVRIAHERTKQVLLVCLTFISLFLATIPFLKVMEFTATQQTKE